MAFLESTASFVIFIGALVFFHELGHFLVAKLFNIKVLRFSIGFGPRLFSWQRGETEYCLSALPLGGYVKMLGDTPGAEVEGQDAPRAFSAKPVWQRSLVLLAGPGFNLLLAFFIYVAMFGGQQSFGDTKVGIVSRGEPAWHAGLRPGDRVVSIAGEPVSHWEELRQAIASRPRQELSIVYERDGQRFQSRVKPLAHTGTNVFQEPETQGRIGVSLQYLRPVLAVVDPDSPAALAGLKTGDTVVSVAGQPVAAWHEVREKVEAIASDAIALRVKRDDSTFDAHLTPVEPIEGLDPGLFSSADARSGRYTGLVNKDSVIHRIEPGTPAQRALLQVGDRLLAVAAKDANGHEQERAIGVWAIDLAAIHAVDMRNEVTITFQRGGSVQRRKLNLVNQEQEDELKNRRVVKVFGAFNDPSILETYLIERHVGPFEAIETAATQVAEDTTLIAKGLAKVIGGSLPFDSMGGPIMLFVIADEAAKRGWQHYLRMMAMISVNLGIVNILPIPVLDGGHLMFCLIEAVRRRPPSLRVRELANVFGLVVLLVLMVLVFSNDIMRYVLG